MSLEALMAHLQPSDSDLTAMQTAGEESLQKAISQIGVVNLASKTNEVCSHFSCSLGISRIVA